MSEFLPPNQAIIQADIAARQAAEQPAEQPQAEQPEGYDWNTDPANDPAYGWDEPAPESGLSPELEEALYEQGYDPLSYQEQIDEAIQEQVLTPHYQAGRLAAEREARYAEQEQGQAALAQAAHEQSFQTALEAQPDIRQAAQSGEAAVYLDSALNVLEEDLREQGYTPEQVSEAVQADPKAFYDAAAKLVNDAIKERAIIDRNLKLV
jgi:hypothetical protein